MGKVCLELPSWVAVMLDAKVPGWLTVEKEIAEDATAISLLMSLVSTYPGFRQALFNPDTGHLNDQVNVILNDKLLTFQEVTQTKLRDGDTIMLVPIYFGG